MGATQAMKRIPLIKFPQRHRKPSGSASASQAVSADGNAQQSSFTRMKVPVAPSNVGSGGKASLQPKRTPVSNEEIEAILLGGCF
ncbi:hypothetical protein PVL29_001639 [Vitis rotundifolia]|uniref:Uncharacterized protein n=2 Tax=Vitis TaxID=3603 RepID=D7TVF9_VITVI|eukprot:XP_002269985.1 PREDICTED: uncharacterized protein LOC100259868 [Vitis vinifera]